MAKAAPMQWEKRGAKEKTRRGQREVDPLRSVTYVDSPSSEGYAPYGVKTLAQRKGRRPVGTPAVNARDGQE